MRGFRFSICLFAALIAAASLRAQDAPQSAREVEKRERERELEILKGDLERAEAVNARLKAEVDAIKNDRTRLAKALQDSAARMRETEVNLAATEQRLAPLAAREGELRAGLEARRDQLAALLGAVQRMGRNAPPAILMQPDDALRAIRTAILMGAVVPELRAEAETLVASLRELAKLKGEIEAERTALAAARGDLDVERRRLAALVEERQRLLVRNQLSLATDRTRLQTLAKRTETLRELIAGIDQELAAAARKPETPSAANRPPAIDPSLALADPERTKPAIPFGQAKGRLVLPVIGSILRQFGALVDPKTRAGGISIQSPPGTTVVSPCDGRVVFAGEFRAYGNLLILDAGDGYHVLLAGMEQFTVEVGQFVRLGESVAVMGLRPDPASSAEAKPRTPILYVEFRKDGESIDPGPWWLATEKQKVRG
jgi:septal ring factor EnvC (AmiA/AmiB activator)